MYRKKGTEALNVSVLVAFIALFIIIYVVLLPPEDREAVLNITDGGDGSGVRSRGFDIDEDTLLIETPGLLRPIREESVLHELSPIDLFVRKEPKIIELAQSIFVSNSIFSDNDQTISFSLSNLDETDNLDIFFTVGDPRGRLILTLNGNIIFNSKANQLVSVDLPLNFIKKQNILKISASNSFIFSNHYTLNNFKLRQNFLTTNIEESRTFFVPQQELDSIERVMLNFFVFCNSPDRIDGQLTLSLNEDIFQRMSLPCIGDEFTFDLDENDIEEGINKLTFRISDGDFRFTDIEVDIEVEGRVFPTFRFTIDEDELADIDDNDVDVILEATFLDDGDRKEAQILINGKKIFIDTEDDEFREDISRLIFEGSNEIKIIPVNTFEMIDLRVFLEEN